MQKKSMRQSRYNAEAEAVIRESRDIISGKLREIDALQLMIYLLRLG